MVEVINHIYMDGEVADAQKHGIIACVCQRKRTN
jgi:hypothetical protein